MKESPDIKYEIEPAGCGERHALCRDFLVVKLGFGGEKSEEIKNCFNWTSISL